MTQTNDLVQLVGTRTSLEARAALEERSLLDQAYNTDLRDRSMTQEALIIAIDASSQLMLLL